MTYRKLRKLYREKKTPEVREKMELFISTIPDKNMKRLLRLYFVDGWSWLRVAFEMGWTDESSPRKKAKAYLGAVR